MPRHASQAATLAIAAFALMPSLAAAQDARDLAMQLANPLADLASIPFTLNYDDDVGEAGDSQTYGNVQAIVPFALSPRYNLLSRTILPIGSADAFQPTEDDLSGIGDITQALFLAPKRPNIFGWHWGFGPVFVFPTGEEEANTSGQWSAGWGGALVRQSGNWTVGAVHKHVWSFAGDSDRDYVNESFLDPFLVFTTASATSYSINAPVVFDWHDRDWSVPLEIGISQMVALGRQPVEIGAAARYWLESPDDGPEDWGARFTITFPFPR